MKFRAPITLTIAIALLTSCSSATKPKTLNGKHRQPINTDIHPAHAMAGILPTQQASSDVHATPPCIPGTIATPRPLPDKEHIEKPARVFRFQFPYGGTALARSGKTASEWAELIDQAKHAQWILVRGRTDAATHSQGDEHIALHRAINTRNALVTHGIDPARIRIDYLSGGNYLADNTTPKGRQQNRRVEIELWESTSGQLATTR